jgi:hypothetical protein
LLEHATAKHDDSYVEVFSADLLEQLVGAHVRQVEIGDNQGGPRRAELLDGLPAIGC